MGKIQNILRRESRLESHIEPLNTRQLDIEHRELEIRNNCQFSGLDEWLPGGVTDKLGNKAKYQI